MLASVVIALALAMKLMMPAGFMPTVTSGQIIVSICSGTGPTTMAIAIPGLEHGGQGDHGKQDGAEQPCAFAGLIAPLAAADLALLAIAILFVIALGFRPMVQWVATAPPYLRPPLRGPPAAV